MSEKTNGKAKGCWVNYRPDIKIHDCTVRDGGLINNHLFEDGFVKAVYDTCVAAGVDYMELGYKGDKKIYSPTKYGKWKFCDEDDMRRIVGDNDTSLKLSVMADADRCNYRVDIPPKSQSVIDCVRVACYIHQIPMALDMVKDAVDKGYEACVNLMAASTILDKELTDGLAAIAQSPVSAVYIVDSFGALYSEQIHYLTMTYLRAIEGTDIEIGIHTHNNQELAYANTIEALISGASRLDATISGMGRGAGNCSLELLIGFLKNPKFHLRPVLECVRDQMQPLRKELDWGYSIPYMITGQFNRHPNSAIKYRASEQREDVVGFFDQTIEEE